MCLPVPEIVPSLVSSHFSGLRHFKVLRINLRSLPQLLKILQPCKVVFMIENSLT